MPLIKYHVGFLTSILLLLKGNKSTMIKHEVKQCNICESSWAAKTQGMNYLNNAFCCHPIIKTMNSPSVQWHLSPCHKNREEFCKTLQAQSRSSEMLHSTFSCQYLFDNSKGWWTSLQLFYFITNLWRQDERRITKKIFSLLD